MRGRRAIGSTEYSLVLAGLMLFSAAPARGDIQPELRRKLEYLDAKAAEVTDMFADFEEQMFSTLLRKPVVSRGTVKVKGEHTRWDTVEPRPTTLVTSPEEVRIYYPSLETVEVYPVLDYLRPLVISPVPRLAMMEKSFRIEASDGVSGGLNLVLKPLQKQLAEFIGEVRVQIDEASGFARRVEMRGADGDRTVIIFSNVRFNTGLSDADVNFVLPPDVKIVRPMSPNADSPAAGPGDKGNQ